MNHVREPDGEAQGNAPHSEAAGPVCVPTAERMGAWIGRCRGHGASPGLMVCSGRGTYTLGEQAAGAVDACRCTLSAQAGVVATAQQVGKGWDPERGALSTTRSPSTR